MAVLRFAAEIKKSRLRVAAQDIHRGGSRNFIRRIHALWLALRHAHDATGSIGGKCEPDLIFTDQDGSFTPAGVHLLDGRALIDPPFDMLQSPRDISAVHITRV